MSDAGVTQEGTQGICVTGSQPVVSDNVEQCALPLKEIASCLSSVKVLHLMLSEHATHSQTSHQHVTWFLPSTVSEPTHVSSASCVLHVHVWCACADMVQLS